MISEGQYGNDSDKMGPALTTDEADSLNLRNALFRLELLGGDPYLRMQAFNLAIIEPFVNELERELLDKLHSEEGTPLPEAVFLSALSQMWIFAAYEILRTWRGRAKDIIKWAENGALETKLRDYKQNPKYPHVGRLFRAGQIERVLAEPASIERIRNDLKQTHMLFARLEAIRVSIAKHEVKGRSKSVALRPGYARINRSSGSLDYELENGAYSMGFISRRDVADEIRSLLTADQPPTDEVIAEFDAYMRGPSADSV